jgi:HAD superfamily hydrolase (TIGR01459 family)
LPPEIAGLSALAPGYDGLLCDIWGVVHNGVAAFPDAVHALSSFRRQGGTVILITNSPRTSLGVADQLQQLEVKEEAWDEIITSGDLTRELLVQRCGQSAYHLGPERDGDVFEGTGVRVEAALAADFIVCTGLFDDEVEGPEDYRNQLVHLRDRDMEMICSNPDLVVQRGANLIYCAGALAALYAELGGRVIYTGKPWQPIYEAGFALMEKAKGQRVSIGRILAVGDAIGTDLLGARNAGIDSLFVLGGIHSAEISDVEGVRLEAKLADADVAPVARQSRLVW